MAGAESRLVAAWYRGAWWLWLLRPLELLFRCVVALRKALYRFEILPRFVADKPLVVVGNITVGGTGKTPIVLALVEHLQSRGIRPGVVSRGYGASGSDFPHTVTDQSTADHCGDEALLIFLRTGCPCVVAPSRPEAVQQLLRDFDIDILLSDDGLQHYAMARDMEIAVLDHSRGIGNGFCLPAGPLREPASRLRNVDYLLYRGSEDPARGVRYTPVSLVNLANGELNPVSPGALAPDVYGVAGIGQPRQFFDSLKGAGFNVAEHSFPDHYLYGAGDFTGMSDKPIIMTEKDAVKCRQLVGENAWYLKIDAQLPQPLLESVVALAQHNAE
jgi:tetraacyldisaccharide 4'-kinase